MKPTAIKFIEANEDELLLDGYLALWGGQDLQGEHFTKATQFDSNYTDTGRLYVDWEHGLEPDTDADGSKLKQPGADDVLGFVDWTTKREDDIGLLARHVLNRRERYVTELVEPLALAGLLGTSSEAIPTKTERTEDGEIIRWPLKRQTLTVMPAETRLMTEQQISVVKAIAENYPHLKTLFGDVVKTDRIEAETVKTTDPESVTAQGLEEAQITEESIMTEEVIEKDAPEVDVAAIAREAAAEAVKAYQAEQPKPKAEDKFGVNLEVVEDGADKAARLNPYKSFGEFLIDVYRASVPGGATPDRLKATGLSEGVGADGGFLVQTDFAGDLAKHMYEQGVLASRVRRIPVSANSNGITMNAINETARATGSRWGGVQAYWLNEAGSKTSSKPAFREIDLKLRKLIGLCYATDELLQDAAALGSIIQEAFADEFSWMVDDAIYNGLGGFQPLGFMASGALVSVAKETGQAAATIVTENIHKMYSRRLGAASNYVWLINQDVEPQLYELSLSVGTGGMPVYMPPGGLSDAPYGRLMGLPVLANEHSATLGTVGDIVLADLSQYVLIDKGGTQFDQSIHVNFTYDETVFRFVYRVDGQPVDAAPVTPANSTATQSPFIALADRS